MEQKAKEDEVHLRQIEYQLVWLGIVLTANNRKPNKEWFMKIGIFFPNKIKKSE